jgi:hypothetical protein
MTTSSDVDQSAAAALASRPMRQELAERHHRGHDNDRDDELCHLACAAMQRASQRNVVCPKALTSGPEGVVDHLHDLQCHARDRAPGRRLRRTWAERIAHGHQGSLRFSALPMGRP